MINANGLTKNFGPHRAVDHVSLQVDKSQVFGLLGPNASGKTTVIRMMCGILEADGGSVRIDGQALEDMKGDIGYVAQYFGQYEELTVWENLSFYARMYNVTNRERLVTLLDRYELTPYKDRFAGTLSGGYKRRLALVCALAHDPKVIFLDEPTAGIDPVTRKHLWDDFYRLSNEGKTLFVTTHYMEEAQRCHQLAFLSAGKLVAEGTPESIKHALGSARVYSMQADYLPALHQMLLNMDGIILVNQFGDELRVVVSPGLDQHNLQEMIESQTGKQYPLNQAEPNLEDVFIALTQARKDEA